MSLIQVILLAKRREAYSTPGPDYCIEKEQVELNENDIVTANGFTFRKISAFVPSRSKQLKSGIASQYFPFSLQGNNHIHLSERSYLLA